MIGIIALLIGILLPTLSKARSRAQAVQCMANLHSIGEMFFVDLNDSKQMGLLAPYTLPLLAPAGYTKISQNWFAQAQYAVGGAIIWDYTQGFLTRYMRDTPIVVCPAVANAGYAYTSMLASSSSTVPNVNYGYNSHALTGTVPPQLTTLKISEVQRPAETVALAESATVTGGALTPYYVSSAVYSSPSFRTLTPTFIGRHSGTGKVLWYDGHVTGERPYLPVSAANFSSFQLPYVSQIRAAQIGYLTPLTPTSTPEPTLCSDPSEYYYYWMSKSIRW